MGIDPAELRKAALSLPKDERAGLAYELLQSLLPATALAEDDPVFQRELDHRVDAYEAGETSVSDWADVSERLRAILKRRYSRHGNRGA